MDFREPEGGGRFRKLTTLSPRPPQVRILSTKQTYSTPSKPLPDLLITPLRNDANATDRPLSRCHKHRPPLCGVDVSAPPSPGQTVSQPSIGSNSWRNQAGKLYHVRCSDLPYGGGSLCFVPTNDTACSWSCIPKATPNEARNECSKRADVRKKRSGPRSPAYHAASPIRSPSKRPIPLIIHLLSVQVSSTLITPSPGRARYIWFGSNGRSSLLPKKGKSKTNGTRESTVYRMTRTYKHGQSRGERGSEGDREREREQSHMGEQQRKTRNRVSERNEHEPELKQRKREKGRLFHRSTWYQGFLRKWKVLLNIPCEKNRFICHAPSISKPTTVAMVPSFFSTGVDQSRCKPKPPTGLSCFMHC